MRTVIPAQFDGNSLKMLVLRGGCCFGSSIVWKSPNWNILVFMSSATTDKKIELLELIKICKELSKEAEKYDIIVNFTSLQWNKTGSILDNRTWLTCKREIERCRSHSPGIFFLSLLSEEYEKKLLD